MLNQLCNQSQGSNTTRRDACYGCFYRASILPQGYPMLVAMSACADTYLNNTSYGHCQAYLRVRTRNDRLFILFSNIRFVILRVQILQCVLDFLLLQNVTRMPNGRSSALIYCSFLECIRQVNKNSLVRLNSEPIAIKRVTRYAILRLSVSLRFTALNTTPPH